MYLTVADDLTQYFCPDKPLFEQIMALRGEIFRTQKGRMTERITLGGTAYFIKKHKGVGGKEIIKNLLQGRLPVMSARNEWLAIRKLQSLNVPTPKICGYGQSGLNPARLQSFILMQEIAPAISLEALGKRWQKTPPAFTFKQALLYEVARMTRLMHANGINHRDLYLCHFLLDMTNTSNIKLYLIDLHRAQLRASVPERWMIKDLAGLYFSSKDIGLTQRDLYRFMKYYRNKDLRAVVDKETKFWQKVKKRGEQLYRDHQ